MFPAGVGVEQRGVVETAPLGAHAVALHHEFGGAFGGNWLPYRRRDQMHRDRDFIDDGTELAEQIGPRLDLGIDVRFRARVPKAFSHDADAQTLDATTEGFGVTRNLWSSLPRVQSIC